MNSNYTPDRHSSLPPDGGYTNSTDYIPSPPQATPTARQFRR